MSLYNVEVKVTMTMVVQAEDDDHAIDVAEANWIDGLSDNAPEPQFNVRGEVTKASDLRDGWCVNCQPYGGKTVIRELLNQAQKGE